MIDTALSALSDLAAKAAAGQSAGALPLALALVALLLAGAVTVELAAARERRLVARLARCCPRLEKGGGPAGPGGAAMALGRIATPLVGALSRIFFARERERAEMRALLRAAGYRGERALTALALAKIVGAALGLGAATLGAGALFGDAPFALQQGVLLAGGAVIGAIAPEYGLRAQRDARKARLRDALPDAIDLMVIAAYAGQSLDMAIDRVSREMRALAPDLAEELTITTAELQALPDRAEALRSFGERLDLREARAFALTLVQTIRYGSPFTESLKALGGDLRQARMIALEERGAKLPALLTLPLIVFIMPAVFVVVVGPAIVAVSDMFAATPGAAP